MWKGAQDFVRCSEAMASRGDHWVYAVLTFPRTRSAFDYYKSGFRMWQKLNQRMTGRLGKIEYIQTWEAHKDGYPHLNVVLHNEALWSLCKGDRWRSYRDEFESHSTSVGFGSRTWVEPLREGTGLTMSGYLTKLSRELTGSGEKNQIPLDAPAHFRRLRASRGLLPPVYHQEGWTGCVVPPGFTGISQKDVQDRVRIALSRGLLPPVPHREGFFIGALNL